MNRSTTTAILVGTIIFLAALFGMLGLKLYRNVSVVAGPMRSSAMVTTMSLTPDAPKVSHVYVATKTGVEMLVTISNPTVNTMDEVRITTLQVDSYFGKGLPVSATKLLSGRTVKLRIRIPGLKTTTPSYESFGYDYHDAYSSGSSGSTRGIPPTKTASPSKTTQPKGRSAKPIRL